MPGQNSGFQDTQQERRKGSVTHEDLEAGRRIMASHIDDRFDALEKLIESGFPEGDLTTHRKVHEGYIKDAADRAALFRAVREQIVKGLTWALLLLIGSAVWEHLARSIKVAT